MHLLARRPRDDPNHWFSVAIPPLRSHQRTVIESLRRENEYYLVSNDKVVTAKTGAALRPDAGFRRFSGLRDAIKNSQHQY